MGATSRSGASSWRVAVPLALSALFPLAAGAAPTPVEELHALFPTVRARFSSDVRFEAASWRSGSRAMAGFRARSRRTTKHRPRIAPGCASPPSRPTSTSSRARACASPCGRSAPGRCPPAAEPGALAYSRRLSRHRRLARAEARSGPRSTCTCARAARAAPFRLRDRRDGGHRHACAIENGQVRFLDAGGKGLLALAPVVVDAAGRHSAHGRALGAGPHSGRSPAPEAQPRPDRARVSLARRPELDHDGEHGHRRRDGIGILLHNGKVLVTAHRDRDARSSTTPPPERGPRRGPAGRAVAFAAATLLNDGRVLACGGTNFSTFAELPQVRPRHEHMERRSPAWAPRGRTSA